jgi:hypothetical protein
MPSDARPLVALAILGALLLLLIAWAAAFVEARSLRKRARNTPAKRMHAFGAGATRAVGHARHASQRGGEG